MADGSPAPGGPTLTIAPAAHEAIIEHARSAVPSECVGLLLGVENHVSCARPLATAHASPTAFEADPLSIVEAQDEADGAGLEIVGYYHSHPEGDSTPSATDRARHLWPDLPPYFHVIVSRIAGPSPQVRAFDMGAGAWRPVELRIDGQ